MESDQLASTRRVDPEVLRPYLEARYHASQLGADSIQKSITLYQQAIERAPEFAPAHSGLAFSHIFLCGMQLAPREGMPKAKVAALRALQLDEGLAEAQAALGSVSLQYDCDWNTAEWRIGQAIRLNPSLPSPISYAPSISRCGRPRGRRSRKLCLLRNRPVVAPDAILCCTLSILRRVVSNRRPSRAEDSSNATRNFPQDIYAALALAKLGKEVER
jgi:hypothetical protein